MGFNRHSENHNIINSPAISNQSKYCGYDKEENSKMESETPVLEDNKNIQYYSDEDGKFYDCCLKLTHSQLIVKIFKGGRKENQGDEKDVMKSPTNSDLLIPVNYIANAYSQDELINDWTRLYDEKLAEATDNTFNKEAGKQTNSCDSIQDKMYADKVKSESDSALSKTDTEISKATNSQNNRLTEYLYISIYSPIDHNRKNEVERLSKGTKVIILSFKKHNTLEKTAEILNADDLGDDGNNKYRVDVSLEDQTSTNSVNRWVRAIMIMAHQAKQGDLGRTVVDSPNSISSDSRKILIMINPFGGQGKAMRIFKKRVLPMIVNSNVGFELFITQRPNDARDFMANPDTSPNKWRSIVTLSGDGLFHEVINGLMIRDDWEKSISVPLGVIPAGSGNGLAHSLIDQDYPNIEDKDCVALSTMNVIRGDSSSADLVKVSINASTVWSFLSVGWGLLADIDIESERLRILGEFRFTVWSLVRAFCLKTYRGKLSYQLIGEPKRGLDGKECQDSASERSLKTDDQTASNNLIEIEDDFVCVYAAYQTHLSSDIKLVPNAKLNDGAISLLYIKGELSSSQVINFLLSMKTGAHVDLPYVTSVVVKSFTLEPLVKSRLTIDGEVIPWQEGHAIHAEVVPNLARFICKP